MSTGQSTSSVFGCDAGVYEVFQSGHIVVTDGDFGDRQHRSSVENRRGN
jgi:hypothetical protein